MNFGKNFDTIYNKREREVIDKEKEK